MNAELRELLDGFGLQGNSEELYLRAFTHSSYSNEHKECKNYERLEFLGDKVLDLVVTDYLFNLNVFNEGEMTKKKQEIISEFACSQFAYKLGLEDFVRLGKGQEKNEGLNEAIIADVFESFIAVIYLEEGFEFVTEFLREQILDDIEVNTIGFSDYKSKIQELLQADSKEAVTYKVLSEEKQTRGSWFVVAVYHGDLIMGEGSGSSKKDAEKEAARDAIEKLNKMSA